ncbi:HD-GYP domain-containing protein [Aquibacillus sp. 3ASR75-11]|uniref:HD-GYP domain-containing protein n=1 Tax=Terrihalobacillus insolitus TaxID=2950438 RepID=A0A9X4AN46_9BACI|nr:HD-GYP domain-containing protein [Terrihalobacillus insolitus]MDC3426112.1 HD-GYP domain-containing protein [Terrihalobacillus insolitus]
MIVSPTQMVIGCIILKDVIGKTNRPLIPKNTVVNEKHITILKKFLVHEVEVASRLSYGAPFVPKPISQKDHVQENDRNHKKSHTKTFADYYLDAVQGYKQLFVKWQRGLSIEIKEVRKLLTPLLDKIDDIGLSIYQIHTFASARDYFYHHQVAVSLLSAFLAKKMSLNEWKQVGLAGLLADCGMAKLQPSLINKDGALTKNEYKEIQKHPTFSYKMVDEIPSLTTAIKLGILQHHERLDGTGYPMGVKEEKIHSYANIIAVCDMYHAMTSERLYRKKCSPFKAIEEMLQDQFGKYDYEMIRLFVDTLTNFTKGTMIRLSNNSVGQIVFVDDHYPTRPIVRLKDSGELIALKNETSIYIEEIQMNDETINI